VISTTLVLCQKRISKDIITRLSGKEVTKKETPKPEQNQTKISLPKERIHKKWIASVTTLTKVHKYLKHLHAIWKLETKTKYSNLQGGFSSMRRVLHLFKSCLTPFPRANMILEDTSLSYKDYAALIITCQKDMRLNGQ
jgi:hypothetical protein